MKIVSKTIILSGPRLAADQPASVLLTEDNSSSASYLNETLHVPRLNMSSAETSSLIENKLGNFLKFKKNMVRNTLKSARGPWRSSPGGVLLSEFETSPLQVI